MKVILFHHLTNNISSNLLQHIHNYLVYSNLANPCRSLRVSPMANPCPSDIVSLRASLASLRANLQGSTQSDRLPAI